MQHSDVFLFNVSGNVRRCKFLIMIIVRYICLFNCRQATIRILYWVCSLKAEQNGHNSVLQHYSWNHDSVSVEPSVQVLVSQESDKAQALGLICMFASTCACQVSWLLMYPAWNRSNKVDRSGMRPTVIMYNHAHTDTLTYTCMYAVWLLILAPSPNDVGVSGQTSMQDGLLLTTWSSLRLAPLNNYAYRLLYINYAPVHIHRLS